MGNSAVLSHLEGTQKMVAVVINCPRGHPHSVRGAAILASGLKGFLLSGVLASEEKCPQMVVKQDWFSPPMLVFMESTMFLEASGFKE